MNSYVYNKYIIIVFWFINSSVLYSSQCLIIDESHRKIIWHDEKNKVQFPLRDHFTYKDDSSKVVLTLSYEGVLIQTIEGDSFVISSDKPLILQGTTSVKTLALTAPSVFFLSPYSGQSLQVNTGSQGTVYCSNDIKVDNCTINAHICNNSGLLQSSSIEVQSDHVRNTNCIIAEQWSIEPLQKHRGLFENNGNFHSHAAKFTGFVFNNSHDGTIRITTLIANDSVLDNSGYVYICNHGGASLFNKGLYEISQPTCVTRLDTLDNKGLMKSFYPYDLIIEKFSNHGSLVLMNNSFVTARTMINEGSIDTEGSIQTLEHGVNKGIIKGVTKIHSSSGDLYNICGTITSDKPLEFLYDHGVIENKGGVITSNKEVFIKAVDIENTYEHCPEIRHASIEAPHVSLVLLYLFNKSFLKGFKKITIDAHHLHNEKPEERDAYVIHVPLTGGNVIALDVEITTDDIVNEGGRIEAKNKLYLVTKKGDVINRTLIGTQSLPFTSTVSPALIRGGTVEIIAKSGKLWSDADIKGSRVKLYGDKGITLQALIGSYIDYLDFYRASTSLQNSESTIYRGSVEATEDNCELSSQGPIKIQGARLDAAKNITLSSPQGVFIGPHYEYHSFHDKKFTVSRKECAYIHTIKKDVTPVSPIFSAGDSIIFSSNDDIFWDAVIFNAGRGIYVQAERLIANAAEEKTVQEDEGWRISYRFFLPDSTEATPTLEYSVAKEVGSLLLSLLVRGIRVPSPRIVQSIGKYLGILDQNGKLRLGISCQLRTIHEKKVTTHEVINQISTDTLITNVIEMINQQKISQNDN